MTKPALSATALLTSSSDMVSKFRVLMPTPACSQQEAFRSASQLGVLTRDAASHRHVNDFQCVGKDTSGLDRPSLSQGGTKC